MPAISTFANLFSLGTLLVAAWVAFHMATKPSNSNLNGKLELCIRAIMAPLALQVELRLLNQVYPLLLHCFIDFKAYNYSMKL